MPATHLNDARVVLRRVESSRDVTKLAETIVTTLKALAVALGWGIQSLPFGNIIQPGMKVLVKPNWVNHVNEAGYGLSPVVTNGLLLRSVVETALSSDPRSLTIGDAPLQGCNLPSLLKELEIAEWAETLSHGDPRFGGLLDFRRTRGYKRHGVMVQSHERAGDANYIMFDLGQHSLLEPITSGIGTFRVAQYNPSKLAATHGPGMHRYLVSRAVIEADVIINLPKLKTHKKAGITNALKNVIGINGHKEFLPHHRAGGSFRGGDSYPGSSALKRLTEAGLDLVERVPSHWGRAIMNVPSRILSRLTRLLGDDIGVEGAWSGNDTIWRTCLDLNRVLLYGTKDGNLATSPQRRVVTISDALVAGQGEGPLGPEPLELNLLLAANNSVALDWVSAMLLGYDPDLVPLIRRAFDVTPWPLAAFSACETAATLVADPISLECLLGAASENIVKHPAGWSNQKGSPIAVLNRVLGSCTDGTQSRHPASGVEL